MPRLVRRTPRSAIHRLEILDFLAGCLPPPNYDATDAYKDFNAVFGTEQGRRVLALIYARCHMWETTNRGEDTHDTAFCEGMRDIALWLQDLIADAPEPQPAQTADEELNG